MKLQYSNNDEFFNIVSSSDALFHYTNRTAAIEGILSKDKFKFSSLVNSNDPYEYKEKLIGAGGWGWFDDIMKDIHGTLEVLNKLLINNSYYISCCENTFKNNELIAHGFLKSRMWAQYGENHYGMCLVFSKEKLLDKVKDIKTGGEFLIYGDNVTYSDYFYGDTGYDSVDINQNSFDNATPEEIALSHINKYYKELFFSKQSDYEDESKYRIFAIDKNLQSSNIIEIKVSDYLIGIILGDRFPKVYEPTIKSICNKINLKYKRLHWESREYFLSDFKK